VLSCASPVFSLFRRFCGSSFFMFLVFFGWRFIGSGYPFGFFLFGFRDLMRTSYRLFDPWEWLGFEDVVFFFLYPTIRHSLYSIWCLLSEGEGLSRRIGSPSCYFLGSVLFPSIPSWLVYLPLSSPSYGHTGEWESTNV